MKNKALCVLIVEDSKDDALLIIRGLKKGGYNPVYELVETAAAMKKALHEKQWDIILCDYSLPQFNAPSAIAALKETNVNIPIIIISGTIGEETAIECMRLGAQDYIMKSNLSRLCPAIARELKESKVRNKQKHTEEKLRREELRFQSLVENSSDIIVVINLEGIITYINSAVERVLGFKPEERIGASGFELVHPDDMKYLTDSFKTLARDTNSPVIQGEMHLRHKDGSWRTLEAVGSNQVHNNIVESVIVNYRDITERKKTEALLKQSEAQYRLLADHMKDQVWLMDLDLKWTYISPSVEKLSGYKIEELLQLPLDKLITPESYQKAMDFFSIQMFKARKDSPPSTLTQLVELEFRCKDGRIIWIESSFSFIRDEKGKPLSILG
jgi:PAS domain S-box-containing protein